MATAEFTASVASREKQAVTYRIAASRIERIAAFRLVYASYLRSGLGDSNRYGMRVTPYHLLPTTEIFIAKSGGRIISTVSLITDGRLGLPMESSYPSEVTRCRAQGMLVGEVSCLADRQENSRQFLEHFCGLARVLAQYARLQGVHALLMVAHPRHARFYTRYLGFEMIGGLTACAYVRNNPAVALCLDFDRIDRNPPACYEAFFGDAIPFGQLQPHPMDPAERAYFRQFVDPCFRQVAPGQFSPPAEPVVQLALATS